jgi:predicted permease
MLNDLKYAARLLLKSKGWTAMVVLSLALGIGANTVLFSAINGLVVRTLPVDDPHSLVRLRRVGQNDMVTSSSDYGSIASEGGQPARATLSFPIFEQLRAANRTLTDLFAGAPMSAVSVAVDNQAEIATAYIASGNYHSLLGVTAVVGRTIAADDDRADAQPVAVISHAFWTRRFGRDPGVVGKVIRANDTPVTIVGVLPPGFSGVQRVLAPAHDLGFPLALDPLLNSGTMSSAGIPRLRETTNWWLQVVGRLKPGVTAEQVEGNLAGVFEETARGGMMSYLAGLPAEEQAASYNSNRKEVPRLRVSSAARGIYDANPADVRSVRILTVVVALILLIVCANVANLQLSRAASRRREVSVRMSLGATRSRLVRQLLTESVVLASFGASAGLLIAVWGRQLLPGSIGQAPLDWRVLAFTCALTLGTGLLFGVVPACQATRTVGLALKETGRTVTGSRSWLGKALLLLQVAVSLVLLIGAGLFLRTVENLRNVQIGFNPANLVIFRVSPELIGYDEPRIRGLYDRMSERLVSVSGVRDATLSSPPLLSGGVNSTTIAVQGRPFTRGPHNDINRVRIAPNFFQTMEMRLLAGREFSTVDAFEAPRVAIINDAAVRKFFPNEPPLGRRFGSNPEKSGEFEIVGVVSDAKYNSLRDEAPPTMYVPYTQNAVGGMAFEVRTAADPAGTVGAIREAVRQVDPNLPLVNVTTQIEQIEARFGQERLLARAYATFGGLALLVAAIGLFGLTSYTVARRTNEIGVRMALGARPRDVRRMIMRESLVLVLVGIGLGGAAALAAGRLVASLLFGLQPTDPATMTAAILVVAGVSALAGYLPARRASSVDPMAALRQE